MRIISCDDLSRRPISSVEDVDDPAALATRTSPPLVFVLHRLQVARKRLKLLKQWPIIGAFEHHSQAPLLQRTLKVLARLLDPFDNGRRRSTPGPSLQLDRFEVERLLRQRTLQGVRQILVKWKGIPHSQNTWEPRDSLFQDIPTVVRAFETRRTRPCRQ